jgi:glycosyltransferase involved in cell wall biosynthesis
MKTPISFIIPTRNEERNIRQTLWSVIEWADEVFVLDSFSGDRTIEIAREMGAHIAQRKFDTFSAQKNWALDNLPLRNEWVFFLDADERVLPPLQQEITDALSAHTAAYDGYYVPRLNYFMGLPLRHGGWYPNARLIFFKHRLGRFEDRIVHEHIVLSGKTGHLRHLLDHNDRKGLHQYFERHNVYSTMEAIEASRHLNRSDNAGQIAAKLFGTEPEQRRMLKQLAYRYAFCRPLIKFLWAYVLKRGFLDGRLGFRYCLLQSFYEYQVSLKLMELKTEPDSPMLENYGRREIVEQRLVGEETGGV